MTYALLKFEKICQKLVMNQVGDGKKEVKYLWKALLHLEDFSGYLKHYNKLENSPGDEGDEI